MGVEMSPPDMYSVLAAVLMIWSMACERASERRPGGDAERSRARGSAVPRNAAAGAHLHGEIEGHELADGSQPLLRRAGGQAGEAHLRDRGVAHAPSAVLLHQALGDLGAGGGAGGARVREVA